MLVSSSGLISASSTDRHWTAGAVLVLVLRSEQLPEQPHDEDEVNDPQGLPYFTISEMEQFEERGTCTELLRFHMVLGMADHYFPLFLNLVNTIFSCFLLFLPTGSIYHFPVL